jgi:hypothetical protein
MSCTAAELSPPP